jgi:Carboxypeptidase regulatory-like domain
LTGANVTATNAQTTAKYETVSTETGNYTLAQLPAGVYDLTVELPGFKKYVRQGITVQVSATLEAARYRACAPRTYRYAVGHCQFSFVI